MRRWTTDRTAIDIRLLGYRNRRAIDRLNRRYAPRWWRRWRQRFSRCQGPELATARVYGFRRWER